MRGVAENSYGPTSEIREPDPGAEERPPQPHGGMTFYGDRWTLYHQWR